MSSLQNNYHKFNKNKLLISGFSVILVDQLSKSIATQFGANIVINRGISFGITALSSQVVMSLLLVVFLALLWFWGRELWKAHEYVAGLFFGGSVSNIFDRFYWGGVRDWIELPGIEVHNNIADSIIVISLLLLMAKIYASDKRESKRNSNTV